MCKKAISEKDLNKENYNFIITNVILTQKEGFTYNQIVDKLSDIFENITNDIKYAIKNCILRLRENGYLSEFGSTYSVIQ